MNFHLLVVEVPQSQDFITSTRIRFAPGGGGCFGVEKFHRIWLSREFLYSYTIQSVTKQSVQDDVTEIHRTTRSNLRAVPHHCQIKESSGKRTACGRGIKIQFSINRVQFSPDINRVALLIKKPCAVLFSVNIYGSRSLHPNNLQSNTPLSHFTIRDSGEVN